MEIQAVEISAKIQCKNNVDTTKTDINITLLLRCCLTVSNEGKFLSEFIVIVIFSLPDLS
jgi:hypothetical protein